MKDQPPGFLPEGWYRAWEGGVSGAGLGTSNGLAAGCFVPNLDTCPIDALGRFWEGCKATRSRAASAALEPISRRIRGHHEGVAGGTEFVTTDAALPSIGHPPRFDHAPTKQVRREHAVARSTRAAVPEHVGKDCQVLGVRSTEFRSIARRSICAGRSP